MNDEIEIHIEWDGTIEGPVTESTLQEMYSSGQLDDSTQICAEGQSQWVSTAKMQEIEKSLSKAKQLSEHFDKSGLKPLAVVTSDADGKFSLTIPKNGSYAIVAYTERQVGTETEKYAWLLLLSDGNVVLNNLNMIGNKVPNALLVEDSN